MIMPHINLRLWMYWKCSTSWLWWWFVETQQCTLKRVNFILCVSLAFLNKISTIEIIFKCKESSSRFQVTHRPSWENIIKVLTKSQESTFTRCHNSKEITPQWFKWHLLLPTALSHVLSFYFYKNLERKVEDTVILVFQVKKKTTKG